MTRRNVSHGAATLIPMEMEVPIPLDPDGFLRRECLACNRKCKWLPSDGSEAPPDGLYGCPYCQIRSSPDSFWTEEQVDYLAFVGGQAVLKELESSFMKVESAPPPPTPTDPGDMESVQFGCHPQEPVKVYDGWPQSQPVYCLICGTKA